MENDIVTSEGSNYIAHSGILGMKWGKRRYQNKDGSLTTEGRLRYGSKNDDRDVDAEKKLSSRQMRRRMSDMSDTELQEAINRKQKEKQLRAMLDEEISPGKKKATEILSRIGTDVAVSVGTGAAKSGLNYILTKIAGNNDVAQDFIRSMNISNFGKDKYEWDLEAKKYKRDQDRKTEEAKEREKDDLRKEKEKEARDLVREEEKFQRDLKRDDVREEHKQAREDAKGPNESKRIDAVRAAVGAAEIAQATAKAKMDRYKPGAPGADPVEYDKAVQDLREAQEKAKELKTFLS